ncbi:hypothetical protein D7294_30375 [Streptomyces hoynatensis]|uniref:Uncharacterized protein n=1 Tax=Streptomyces hoynatensis TaxID=1141874 RepID=A0A3A9YFG9_9ACTN|nr:hypothetical protein D7294_30375 [Streptomyces hoynatensis]
METWFADMGNYFAAYPDAPALAVDMALHGPPQGGYALAHAMVRTSDVIDLYPPDGPTYG